MYLLVRSDGNSLQTALSIFICRKSLAYNTDSRLIVLRIRHVPIQVRAGSELVGLVHGRKLNDE